MFTMPELNGSGVAGFHVLKKLFYTTELMMNAGTKRSIVFVLLQMHLVLAIMKSTNKNDRDNPLAELLGIDTKVNETLTVDFVRGVKSQRRVLWTCGSSLIGWPRRDLNEFVRRIRYTPDIDETYRIIHGMPCTSTNGSCVIEIRDGADEGETYEMREKERCLWLLLLYARPGLDQFVAEDSTVFCKEQERMEDGSRARRDIITAKLSYEIHGSLHVCVSDDHQGAVFFEKIPDNTKREVPAHFPTFIEDIISDIPDRSLIYVPKKFAQELRTRFTVLHEKVFEYDNAQWRMVCVGVRTWAWKRMLVKIIFFDALGKITTRSSIQLSLY
jgi:hypothetical protein